MSVSQQYSLRWNNYFRHLTYALDNHRNNDDFVDVSLLCDGRKIKAHKVVLSACSAYFKEIFTDNPHPHPIIIFKFIKFEDLNSIVEFMYQGEVNVQQEALQSFLQTAELLAVHGLTSDEKEKPKTLAAPIDEKIIKTIPSTIRSVNDNTTAITQTTLEISSNNNTNNNSINNTVNNNINNNNINNNNINNNNINNNNSNNILEETAQHLQVPQQQQQQQQLAQISIQSQQQPIQTQIQPIQRSQTLLQQQQNLSTIHQNVHQMTVTAIPQQTLQHLQQIDHHHPVTQPTAHTIHIDTQTDINTSGLITIPITHPSAVKKRKLTFADDDDSIYATDHVNVGYGIKDEPDLVKNSDVTLLRGSIKMDIPEYIISDDQLSDCDGNGNNPNNANTSTRNVTQQYTSEYEILTESEIDEKYSQHIESDNNEITIEMGGLLNNSTTSPVITTTKTTTMNTTNHQQSIENITNNVIINNNNDSNNTTVENVTSKAEVKTNLSADLPNNKWTECQFCKMVITTVNLWRHIRTQHTPQPPRKCELCNKNFKNKYSLREHIRISHEQKLTMKSEH